MLSACKFGTPVSESLSICVSQCPLLIQFQATNFPLHSAFLLKRVERTFHHPVTFLNEPRYHIIHLAGSVVFVHNWLMLVDDQCNALEESR